MSAAEHGPGRRSVAGADGSSSSLSALRWAIRQAGLTGAAVDAVSAWHNPASQGGYGWETAGPGQDYDVQDVAAKTLTEAISSALDPASDVCVRTQVTEGHPRPGTARCQRRRRSARGGQPRARRLRRSAARLSQPALRVPKISSTRVGGATAAACCERPGQRNAAANSRAWPSGA